MLHVFSIISFLRLEWQSASHENERMKSEIRVQTLDSKCTFMCTRVYFYLHTCVNVFNVVFLLCVRAEAAQVAELRWAADGAVRRRPPQGGHVDRWLQFQPHRSE